MSKKNQINIIPVLAEHRNIYVSINPAFTDSIKQLIISEYGSLRNFYNKHFRLNYQTFKWPFKNKYGHNLGRLLKICEFLSIPKQEVIRNIQGYYSWGSHKKQVKIDEILEISPMFVEGYALYLAEGDTGDSGKTKPRKLRFTNSNPHVINFFIQWLETAIPEIDYYLSIIIPTECNFDDNFSQIKIDRKKIKFSKGQYNRQIKYRVCMDNCIIIDLILGIRKQIKGIVLKNRRLACSYLKGLMAGEGTVYNNRSKYVRIEMKNPDEIFYVKKLFTKLRIKFTYHKRTTRKNMESLYIGGRENIKKYYTLVGFGSHKERQRKLRCLVRSYSR